MKPVHPPHAVARLRTTRLARSTTEFRARGGPKGERCAGCRLVLSHCICGWRPLVSTRAGMCLLMSDTEPLKPSNTGWLIADVVPETTAFAWARTEVNPALLTLLGDPQWQPYVVFPEAFVAPERVVNSLLPDHVGDIGESRHINASASKRPLFILLDATWSEARKIFKKSPYLNHLPVLSLQSEQLSRYRLRRAMRDTTFCTAEVAVMCLELAGELLAAQALEAYLDVFIDHYLRAKQQQKLDLNDDKHQRLQHLLLQNA